MIIISTTTAKDVAETAGVVSVTSATGIVAPGPNKTNRVILWIDREAMEVLAVSSTTITVVRGVLGTLRVAHVAGTKIWIGAEHDFEHFQEPSHGLGNYAKLSVSFETVAPQTAADTATLTAAQILGGLITGTPTAAANYTLPTAALIQSAMQAFSELTFLGQSFEFSIKNTSAGANTITVLAGTGGTVTGTATIAQNAIKRFKFVWTLVEGGAPTYTVFSLGSSTF